jgi:hypothetical protein
MLMDDKFGEHWFTLGSAASHLGITKRQLVGLQEAGLIRVKEHATDPNLDLFLEADVTRIRRSGRARALVRQTFAVNKKPLHLPRNRVPFPDPRVQKRGPYPDAPQPYGASDKGDPFGSVWCRDKDPHVRGRKND